MEKGEGVGEIIFLMNILLHQIPLLDHRPVTELAQTWWVVVEWPGGLSEPLTFHLCCHQSLLGVCLGEGIRGLLENTVPALGSLFKAKSTQDPKAVSVETHYPFSA